MILCLETSTNVCSVALGDRGHTAHLREVNDPGAHSGRLTLFVQELLAEAGLRWAELSPVHDIDDPADLASLPPDWCNAPPAARCGKGLDRGD